MSPDPLFNVPPWVSGGLAANDRAITNASAHVAWALAIPLAGHAVDGKRGALVAGLTWIAWTLVQEWPTHQGAAGSEIRTDIVTRLVPTLLVLAWEMLK